jgi:hypothetical protein
MLNDYYDQVVSVDRLALVEAEEGEEENLTKKEFTLHLANVCCHIQPLDASITPDIKDAFGKNYLMFCARADIQEGDRIFWEENEYRIVAVEDLAGLTGQRAPHMEIQIRAFQS